MRFLALTGVLLIFLNLSLSAQTKYNNDPNVNYSDCENCLTFPEEFMAVDEKELIDFASISPERRMDFLLGEWLLYYPEDKVCAYEIFNWFREGVVLEGFQDWAYDHEGKIPWRAKSFFRYVKEDKRWQFQWISSTTSSIFTGELQPDGSFAFYENEFSGEAPHLRFFYPAKYVFKNITKNSFLVEWYDSKDNGQSYSNLTWRLYYKKRARMD